VACGGAGRTGADHVMSGRRGLLDRVAPVLHGQQLAVKEGVGPARHVAGDEDVIGDDAVRIESAARAVADDPPLIGRQAGAVQPLHVADRAERHYSQVDIERVTGGEPGAAPQPVRIPLERHDRDVAAQIDAVLAVPPRGDRVGRCAEATSEKRVWMHRARHGQRVAFVVLGSTPSDCPAARAAS